MTDEQMNYIQKRINKLEFEINDKAIEVKELKLILKRLE